MHRRTFTLGTLALPAAAAAAAQSVEKTRLRIAVGGRPLLFYLPVTIAESLGLFKAEGLAVDTVDFAGGSRALDALVAGSAEVASASVLHVLAEQARGRRLRAFVLHGLTMQMALGVNPRTMPLVSSVASLKGRRVGVTSPGALTHMMLNYLLVRAGLEPREVQVVGVGSGANALSAMRTDKIDALCNLEPVISVLQRTGDIRIVVDLRSVDVSRETFDGAMPAGALIATQKFIDGHPRAIQALTNAVVRATRWIQTASANDVANAVPRSHLLGDRAAYLDAFLAGRDGMSPDGRFPEGSAETAARALRLAEPTLAKVQFEFNAVYSNEFVNRAKLQLRGE